MMNLLTLLVKYLKAKLASTALCYIEALESRVNS